MGELDQLATIISLSMGVAWASGINLYAALLTLGVLANTGNIVLPEQLEIVANPLVMTTAGVMYVVEFLPTRFRVLIPSGMPCRALCVFPEERY